MIECKLEKQVYSFDGYVIHRYHPSGISDHFYIDFVESADIVMDKKGRQHMKINMKQDTDKSVGHWPDRELNTDTLPQAQAFVDEVMRVKASRQE